MNPYILIILLFTGAACNTLPKGEYSRSFIERPYSLPDDVATVSFGANSTTYKVEEKQGNNTFNSEDDENALIFANFENGINNNLSWIYPLGLRWTLLNQNDHTIGISAMTFFIFNFLKIDYWYRLSSDISIRPFFQVTRFNYLYFREKKELLGIDLVWQVHQNFSITFKGFGGEYSGSSGILEDILNDIFGSSTSTEVTGEIKGGGLGFLYSINDRFDFVIDAQYSRIEDNAVNSSNYSLMIEETVAKAGFNYIW
jgi:hypothetical protein